MKIIDTIQTVDQALAVFNKLEKKVLTIISRQQKDLEQTQARLEMDTTRKSVLESEIKRSALVLKNIQTLKGE